MKGKILERVLLILIVGVFSGCQKELPKPETMKIMAGNDANAIMVKSIHVSNQINEERPSIFVRHRTKENNVFVECIVTGVSFRETDQFQQKVGKIIIWVDGKKRSEVTQAAFIIKQLPYGNHHIKLEVVNLHDNPYGISKEFKVDITKGQQKFTSAVLSW